MINLQAKEIPYYTSAEELLEESDLVETDCHVIGWSKKFRIRALTFGKMDKINKLSIDENSNFSESKFVAYTIVEGVIRPNITYEQATKVLESKNGEYIRELSEKIWSIGKLSKKIFDAVMKEEEELVKEENETTEQSTK